MNQRLQSSASREIQKFNPTHFHSHCPSSLYDMLLLNSSGLVINKPNFKCKPPLRILDAPNVVNDSTYSLIDWSSEDMVCLGLQNSLFLRNFKTGITQLIHQLHDAYVYTSLKFNEEILAVSTTFGELLVMDSEQKRVLQENNLKDTIHQMTFNGSILCCATEKQGVLAFDLRQRQVGYRIGLEENLVSIAQEGTLLAAGSSTAIHIWDVRNPRVKIMQLNEDGSCIAWSQHKHQFLISGSTKLKQWKIDTGENTECLNIGAPITGIISIKDRVLCSANKHVNIYKAGQVLGKLEKHTERILGIVASPDQKQICSLGADELLIFWDID